MSLWAPSFAVLAPSDECRCSSPNRLIGVRRHRWRESRHPGMIMGFAIDGVLRLRLHLAQTKATQEHAHEHAHSCNCEHEHIENARPDHCHGSPSLRQHTYRLDRNNMAQSSTLLKFRSSCFLFRSHWLPSWKLPAKKPLPHSWHPDPGACIAARRWLDLSPTAEQVW